MHRVAALALASMLSGCAMLSALDAQLFGVSEGEAAAGLREGLEVGTERAAGRLGRPGGYWEHPRYRIPLPEMVDRASRYLRAGGHGAAVERFHRTLNQAAEQAAQQAVPIFLDAIRDLSFRDARQIVDGPDDAATAFLERRTREQLARSFLPVVTAATDRTGVTRHYKQLTSHAGPLSAFLDKEQADLDQFVVERALDGLFRALAEEEKRLRRDPAARTSQLLQKVFGQTSGRSGFPA